MLLNPMLDVAIGLIFMYLLLSIIVTVVQEFIASTFKLRNKNLVRAIVELSGSDNKANFFEHPLISPLFRGDVDEKGAPKKGGPSYIPKRNFALAILALNLGASFWFDLLGKFMNIRMTGKREETDTPTTTPK